MQAIEIKEKFVKFFESKGHSHLPSSSLVPANDPTLLFANAGMNQFKDYFTGIAKPDSKRAVTIQKVCRAGGKHNDLENVGFTARHHTFFEMLGNFSFGDYFKKEAIEMAWEFLTSTLNISKEKLYVTVHHTDQEAFDLWHQEIGLSKDRIFYRGDKDNFWEMGDTGPCGPSSEIFYDHGKEYSDKNADTSECILDDEGRYVEIWNLVFMQFEKYIEGGEIKRRNLPNPSVDTGAGLERVAAVMQGKYNNFDTDCFTHIITSIEKISSKKYSEFPQWMRVIADHARSTTMLLTDGVIPSNEGRGYVLRRIIRRAVRHLDLLGVEEVSLYKLVDDVFESLGDSYPDNRNNIDFAKKYLTLEEESFRRTLKSGLRLLEKEVEGMEGKTLSGEVIFSLYDTHGFPIDLTEMILREKGLEADIEGFNKAMEKQKERSRQASQFSAGESNLQEFYQIKEKHGETRFLGYDELQAEGAKLLGRVNLQEDHLALVFDKTPFYGESGGQAGDLGHVIDSKGNRYEVLDTQKPVGGIHSHIIKTSETFKEGESFSLYVDKEKRNLTARNHSATHLIHAALQKVLGSHVKQAGSFVGPERLRFDFTQPEALKKDQILKIENLVNAEIEKATSVASAVMTKDQATEKGAMALFGEKYGDEVRVIEIPGFSIELCGGTHVGNTSEIECFKILSEGSLSSGVRRIEAITSTRCKEYLRERNQTLETLEGLFKVKDEALIERLKSLKEEVASKTKEINKLQEKLQAAKSDDLFQNMKTTKDGQPFKVIELAEGQDLRKMADLFIEKFPKGVAVMTSKKGDRGSVIIKTFRGNDKVHSSNLLRDTLSKFDGKGGGKPDMAQGSVDVSKLSSVISEIEKSLGG